MRMLFGGADPADYVQTHHPHQNHHHNATTPKPTTVKSFPFSTALFFQKRSKSKEKFTEKNEKNLRKASNNTKFSIDKNESPIDKNKNYEPKSNIRTREASEPIESSKNSFFTRFRKNPFVSLSTPPSPQTEKRSFIKTAVVERSNSQKHTTTSSKQPPQNPLIPQLSFTQRIKLHKGMRTGKVPTQLLKQSQSQILNEIEKKKSKQKERAEMKGIKNRAHSADAINQISEADLLTEALLAIGEEQPMVARSTPKNSTVFVDERKIEERLRRDCLFEDEFYERMLSDSLTVCDLLQTHLSDCIAGVRARSPTALSSPFTSPPGTPNLSRSSSSQPFAEYRRPNSCLTTTVTPPLQQLPPRVTISVSNGGLRPLSRGTQQFPTAASRSLANSNGNIMLNTANSLPPISPAMSTPRKKNSSTVHFAT